MRKEILRLAPKRTLQWSEVDSEVVILDRGLGELLRLNEVAGFIWKQLNENRSTQEIAERLSRRFATDARSAARDVRDFVHQLRSLELVEECEEAEKTRK